MPEHPTTIPECLKELHDDELSTWLRGLNVRIAEERRRQNAALHAWYKSLRGAAELEKHRRLGQFVNEAPIIRGVYEAAVLLPGDVRTHLMQSYDEIATGNAAVAATHPLAILAGILTGMLNGVGSPPDYHVASVLFDSDGAGPVRVVVRLSTLVTGHAHDLARWEIQNDPVFSRRGLVDHRLRDDEVCTVENVAQGRVWIHGN